MKSEIFAFVLLSAMAINMAGADYTISGAVMWENTWREITTLERTHTMLDGSLWAQVEGSLRWVGGSVEGWKISGFVPYFPSATEFTGTYKPMMENVDFVNNAGEPLLKENFSGISGGYFP